MQESRFYDLITKSMHILDWHVPIIWISLTVKIEVFFVLYMQLLRELKQAQEAMLVYLKLSCSVFICEA